MAGLLHGMVCLPRKELCKSAPACLLHKTEVTCLDTKKNGIAQNKHCSECFSCRTTAPYGEVCCHARFVHYSSLPHCLAPKFSELNLENSNNNAVKLLVQPKRKLVIETTDCIKVAFSCSRSIVWPKTCPALGRLLALS